MPPAAEGGQAGQYQRRYLARSVQEWGLAGARLSPRADLSGPTLSPDRGYVSRPRRAVAKSSFRRPFLSPARVASSWDRVCRPCERSCRQRRRSRSTPARRMIIVPVLLAEQCCASCGGSADIVLVAPGSPPQTAPGGILIRATCMACWPVLGASSTPWTSQDRGRMGRAAHHATAREPCFFRWPSGSSRSALTSAAASSNASPPIIGATPGRGWACPGHRETEPLVKRPERTRQAETREHPPDG